jgi:hypothetical protein
MAVRHAMTMHGGKAWAEGEVAGKPGGPCELGLPDLARHVWVDPKRRQLRIRVPAES